MNGFAVIKNKANLDILTPEQRFRNMSRVRSTNTKPEKQVRSLLHGMGYRFRLHAKDLPGSPDIVLPKYRAVIFVHGCFWHRHPGCKYASTPATHKEFWTAKFEQNKARDRRVIKLLREKNWNVIIVWQCELRDIAALITKLEANLRGRNMESSVKDSI